MPSVVPAPALPLRGWTVIGLRASDQQTPLRRAANAQGASFLGLPGLRLVAAADPPSASRALARALTCPLCLFTSPAAVRFADRLRPLAGMGARAIAIGSGTARALRRAGVAEVLLPARAMRSEDVLALEALSPPPRRVGLVTAPGGRGLLPAALAARGASVLRADVYRREAARLSSRARAGLQRLRPPAAVLLSSGEALANVLDQLEPGERAQLLAACVVAASSRLADEARRGGFVSVIEAGSTLPRQQLAALARHAKPGGFR